MPLFWETIGKCAKPAFPRSVFLTSYLSMGSTYVFKAIHLGIGSKKMDWKPDRSSPRENRVHESRSSLAMEDYAAVKGTDVCLMWIARIQ